MTKKIIEIFICILLICTVLPISANSIVDRTYNPTMLGNTLYVGGSGPNNYTKIQDAIENASDGDLFIMDTIIVFNDSSPYHENVVVDKTINLYGEDESFPVIDGSGGDNVIVRLNDNYCAIRGFRIIGDKSENDMIGIKIDSSDCWAGTNKIMDVDQGIYISSCSDGNCLVYNIISDVKNGIVVDNSDRNDIGDNYISSCSLYGIYICKSYDKYYFQNNYLVYNEIFNNNIGIHIEDSNGSSVFANLINNNSGGLEFCGIVDDSNIYCNNFENNQNWNARDEGNNHWNNSKKGNFWDDYKGIDSNGDGIGDTPYLITGGDNIDSYPLMKPWENHAPSAPIITGPSNGRILIKNDFTFMSTDPEGDDVYFEINWSDGKLGYVGPYPSGTKVTVSHIYYSTGIKTITAYATDEYFWGGELGEFKVTIARTRVSMSSLFLYLLERFPVLQQLLQLLVQ